MVLWVGLAKSTGLATWEVAANVLFVGVTVAVPILILRYWKTLRWQLAYRRDYPQTLRLSSRIFRHPDYG